MLKTFIKKYNKIGLIKPDKIINEISKTGIKEVTLYFNYQGEREPLTQVL